MGPEMAEKGRNWWTREGRLFVTYS